eukprot:NODE_27_length_2570_cov_256.408171_g22_i0.p1 GENE.NODE_27_length_2570_cov_256.408171_g22_i0~~NODE_27_length_2570_cov_256.408171_g22_i0.p1  ORF type:complete len:805 (-),score=211.15 NODE_27_length_2570_cov_256.408171_g22_i0:91-2505(-)
MSWEFSEKVNKAINDVLPSKEIFDQPQFHPTEYINNQFPDEQSLQNLDSLLFQVQDRLGQIDTEMLSTVRAQSLIGGKAGDDLRMAKGAMEGLFTRVKEIKQKAEQSEAMVQNICRDIRCLDNAKRNLTLSIKSLRRVQMLEEAVRQLEDKARQDNYQEAASLLDACNQLLTYFDGNMDVPRIRVMAAHVQATRIELKSKIMHCYSRFDLNLDSDPPPELVHACAVVDALGGNTRKEFLKTFMHYHLEKYRRKFHRGEEMAKLSNTEKRYQWLRRQLQDFDEKLGPCFPSKWNVAQELAVEFCLLTNSELAYQLQVEEKSLDGIILVKALQKTIDFEKELTVWWKGFTVELSTDTLNQEDPDDLTETERIKRKYLRHARQKQKAEVTATPDETEPPQSTTTVNQYKFTGFISSCFEKSMFIYVDYEDSQMHETVERLLAEERWGLESEDADDELADTAAILTSASDLFIYLKESFKRTSTLDRGQTLAKMHRIWSKHLIFYAMKLAEMATSTRGEKSCKTLCIIVNTAEYWATVLRQFLEEIKGKLEEFYHDELRSDDVEDAFSLLINKGVTAVIRGIDAKLEPCFSEMARINWGLVMAVGDQSPYVTGICEILVERVIQVANFLNPTYFRFFCDKFILAFSQKFVAQFYKLKRISDRGCQQLLLDTQCLRGALLDLPNVGNVERFVGSTLSGYSKNVTKELKKAENTLKVLLTPLSDKDLAEQYATLISRPSVPDFVRLMELKGCKKVDLQPHLDILMTNKKVSKVEIPLEEEEGHGKDASLLEDFRRKLESFKIGTSAKPKN